MYFNGNFSFYLGCCKILSTRPPITKKNKDMFDALYQQGICLCLPKTFKNTLKRNQFYDVTTLVTVLVKFRYRVSDFG